MSYRDYFKSEESLREYEKIGQPYPQETYDKWYDDFLKLTRATKEKDIKIEIHNMKRYILKSGEQYIVHDETTTKFDPLGNRKSFYRGGIGKFPIPIPHYEIKVNPEEGYSKAKIITGIDSVDVGYSIPFDKPNIDRLLKYTDGNTQYSISKQDYQSGKRFTIASLHDWIEGDIIELLRFGHIASSYEKQILADEKIGKFQSTPLPTAPAYR
jgi:hypothetical protein